MPRKGNTRSKRHNTKDLKSLEAELHSEQGRQALQNLNTIKQPQPELSPWCRGCTLRKWECEMMTAKDHIFDPRTVEEQASYEASQIEWRQILERERTARLSDSRETPSWID